MTDSIEPPEPRETADASLESQLRRLADRSVAESEATGGGTSHPVDGPLPAVPASRPSRYLAAAAAAAVLFGTFAAVRRDDGASFVSSRSPAATIPGFTVPGAPEVPPPQDPSVAPPGSSGGEAVELPEDEGPVTIWLNSRRFPSSGADLVAVIRNAGDQDLMFGVGATLERWDGVAWGTVGFIGFCTDFWICQGSLTDGNRGVQGIGIPVGPAPGIRDIGIGSTSATPSSPLFLRLPAIDSGTYRIRSEGSVQGAYDPANPVVATGAFEVVEGEVPGFAPVDPGSAGRITVMPVLVEPGRVESIHLTAQANDGGNSAAADIAAFASSLSASATIQRWDGDSWETVAEHRVVLPPQPGPSFSSVAVGPLVLSDTGAYRVVRTTPDGREIVGSLWVVIS